MAAKLCLVFLAELGGREFFDLHQCRSPLVSLYIPRPKVILNFLLTMRKRTFALRPSPRNNRFFSWIWEQNFLLVLQWLKAFSLYERRVWGCWRDLLNVSQQKLISPCPCTVPRWGALSSFLLTLIFLLSIEWEAWKRALEWIRTFLLQLDLPLIPNWHGSRYFTFKNVLKFYLITCLYGDHIFLLCSAKGEADHVRISPWKGFLFWSSVCR